MVSPDDFTFKRSGDCLTWYGVDEKQQQNALEIAKHAGDLYDKFVNLIEGFDTVGSRIDSTKSSYDQAMKKLTGQQNLIKDVEVQKSGSHHKKKN
ncbi:MAG: DNA recombination protein RmuC [Acidimicrobiia bacterium]|nr:DNA recombination protein RmuC [Acidimicrobiia bacterium]